MSSQMPAPSNNQIVIPKPIQDFLTKTGFQHVLTKNCILSAEKSSIIQMARKRTSLNFSMNELDDALQRLKTDETIDLDYFNIKKMNRINQSCQSLSSSQNFLYEDSGNSSMHQTYTDVSSASTRNASDSNSATKFTSDLKGFATLPRLPPRQQAQSPPPVPLRKPKIEQLRQQEQRRLSNTPVRHRTHATSHSERMALVLVDNFSSLDTQEDAWSQTSAVPQPPSVSTGVNTEDRASIFSINVSTSTNSEKSNNSAFSNQSSFSSRMSKGDGKTHISTSGCIQFNNCTIQFHGAVFNGCQPPI